MSYAWGGKSIFNPKGKSNLTGQASCLSSARESGIPNACVSVWSEVLLHRSVVMMEATNGYLPSKTVASRNEIFPVARLASESSAAMLTFC